MTKKVRLSITGMRRSMDVVKEKTLQTAMIEDLSIRARQWVISVEFMVQGEAQFQDFYHLSTALLEESLSTLKAQRLVPEEITILESISLSLNSLKEHVNTTLSKEVTESPTRNITKEIEWLIKETETLKAGHKALVERLLARADTVEEVGKYVSIAVPATSALLALLLGLMVRRSIVNSIRYLLSVTKTIAGGDLSKAVRLKSRDEFGELALAFDNMREELRQNRQKLEELSVTDGLTALYNRRYLEAKLEEEVIRAKRFHHPLSLIFIDIDHFKQYNDSYGHQEGDKVLKGLAETSAKVCLKEIDMPL
jgi:methyl-accepting chemotaxis protein